MICFLVCFATMGPVQQTSTYLLYNKSGPFSFLLCNLFELHSLCELFAKGQMSLKKTKWVHKDQKYKMDDQTHSKSFIQKSGRLPYHQQIAWLLQFVELTNNEGGGICPVHLHSAFIIEKFLQSFWAHGLVPSSGLTWHICWAKEF